EADPLYETYLFFNFIIFIALSIPLMVADAMFVMHLKHRWPEAWDSLGKPGYILSPKVTNMIRGFVRHGDHPILDDPYVKRITVIQRILAPIQTVLFASFIVIFLLMIISR
ncbi:MAG: hypothetical protein JSV70_00410, partial [bacterium]